jgi:mTERF domain-containing protein
MCRVTPELSTIRSPSRPDAVLAFLAEELGLSPPLIAITVARDPKILTCSVASDCSFSSKFL